MDTLNVADVPPAGMTTEAGTIADGLELLRETVLPDGPALPSRVTVPVEDPPATTELGFKLSDVKFAGVTVSVAL